MLRFLVDGRGSADDVILKLEHATDSELASFTAVDYDGI